jgi:hypothetical protein
MTKEKKYTKLEILEKLSDSVDDQVWLHQEHTIELIKENPKLIFSEKQKKDMTGRLHKLDVLNKMSEGLSWYIEKAVEDSKK